MESLYPSEEWNFVFGLARCNDRCGVFSFNSYSNKPSHPDKLKYRAGKTLTHEIGHLFGLRHCTYYKCNMSGVNSGQEGKKYPPYLCPVCLRKLQHVLKFDVRARYEAMLGVVSIQHPVFARI
jgi:archaemetzincin